MIVLLYTVFKKLSTNPLLHQKQFIFDKSCSYLAVYELDIALGNHALHAQGTVIY